MGQIFVNEPLKIDTLYVLSKIGFHSCMFICLVIHPCKKKTGNLKQSFVLQFVNKLSDLK